MNKSEFVEWHKGVPYELHTCNGGWRVYENELGQPPFQGNGGLKSLSGICKTEKSGISWWRRYLKCAKPLKVCYTLSSYVLYK